MKPLVGLFLVAHGLIHASYLTPKPDDPNYPFDFTRGWFAGLAGGAAQSVGIILAVITAACFATAGLAMLGAPGIEALWKPALIAGIAGSLLLLTLFWHRWLVLGIIINALLLYALYMRDWTIGGIS